MVVKAMTTPDKQSLKSIYCRICHEDGFSEELIDPCECSGTMGLIHESCLEKWLSTSNNTQCELCKFAFSIVKKNKPLTESIRQWWIARNNGPQGIAGDFICLLVLTPLCIIATYLCAVGASSYASNGFWAGTGLAILCCMLIATYILWFIVTLRFHVKSWKDWCRHNQDVKLLVKHRSELPKSVEKVVENSNSAIEIDNNYNSNDNNDNSIGENTSRGWEYWLTRMYSGFNEPFYIAHPASIV